MTDRERHATAGDFGVVVADTFALDRRGPDGVIWSLPGGADLNANLVRLAAGGAIPSHTNDEVDVLLVGIAGRGVVTVDGAQHDIAGGTIVAVAKHHERSVTAHEELLYLTVHVARSGPRITTRRDR